MNLVLIAALIAVCGAAKLDNTHQPPASAKTAGGSSGSLLAPFFRSSSTGLGSLPAGGYTNNFQGVVVDAAAAGTRASDAAEESGLGGPRDSYGSTDSKVGDAAFKNSVAGFRNTPFGFNGFGSQKPQNNLGFGLFSSKSERTQSVKDRNSNTLAFAHNIGTNKYSYGFETDNGISVGENGVAAGGVQAQGGYSYQGDDGKEYKVTYTAGKDGYQPTGDHLPTPPPIPYEIVKSLEENAQDEAAGIVSDGSYDAQKYNEEGDYANNNGDGKYNGAQSSQFGKRPESDAGSSGAFGKPSALSGQLGFNGQQNSNAFISTNTGKVEYNQVTGTKFESIQTSLNDDDSKPSLDSGIAGSQIGKPSSLGFGSSSFGLPSTGSFGINTQSSQLSSQVNQAQNTFGSSGLNGFGLKPIQQGIISQFGGQPTKPQLGQSSLPTGSNSISNQQPVKTQFGTQGLEGSLSTLTQTNQVSGNLQPSTSFGSSISKPSLPGQNQVQSTFGSTPTASLPQTITRFGVSNGYLPPLTNAQGLKPEGLLNQNTLSTGSSSILSQQAVTTQFGSHSLNSQGVQGSLSTLSQNAQVSGNSQPSTSFGSSISKPSGQSQLGSAFGSGAYSQKPQGLLSQNTLSTGSNSILSQQPVKSKFGTQTLNQGGQGSLSTLTQAGQLSGNSQPSTSFGSLTSKPSLPSQGQVTSVFGSGASSLTQTANKGTNNQYLPPVNTNVQGLKPQGLLSQNTLTTGLNSNSAQQPVKTQFGTQAPNQEVQSSLSSLSQTNQLAGNLQPSTSFGSSIVKPSLLGQNQVVNTFGTGAYSQKPQGLLSQNTLSTGSNSILSQQSVKSQFGTQTLNQGGQGSLSTLTQAGQLSGNSQPSTSFGSLTSKPSLPSQGQATSAFGSGATSLTQTANKGTNNQYLPPVNTNEQGLKPQGLLSQNTLTTGLNSNSAQQPVKTQFGTQAPNQGGQSSLSSLSQTNQLAGNLQPSTSFGSSIVKPSLPGQNQVVNTFGTGAYSQKPQGLLSQNTLSTGSNSILSQQPVKSQFGTQTLNQGVQGSLATLSQAGQLSGNLQPSTSFGSSITKPSLPGQSQVVNTFGTGAYSQKPQGLLSQNTLSTGSNSILSQQPVKSQFGTQTLNQGVQGSLSTLSQAGQLSGNLRPSTSFGSSITKPSLPGQSQASNTFGSAPSTNKVPETSNTFGTEYLPPVKSNEQHIKPQTTNTFASATASSLDQEGNTNKQIPDKSPMSLAQGQPEESSASASASVGQPVFGVQPAQPLSYQLQTSQPYINILTQKPSSSTGQAPLGSLTSNQVQSSPSSSYASNSQQPTAIPLTELTTPLDTNEPSHTSQGSQPSKPSTSNFATFGSQSLNSYPTKTPLGISSSNAPASLQTLSPTVSPTFSTLSSSRPQGIGSQQFGSSSQVFPTQATQGQESTSYISQLGDKKEQSQSTYSQGQFGVSSTQKPTFGQSFGNNNAYYYNQPSKPFSTPQPAPQGSRFPGTPSYQSSSPFSSYNQNSPASTLTSFSKYPNSPSLAPVTPTFVTQKETGLNQGTASSSNYNGITQATISPFPSASPTASTQFNTPQTNQFGSTPAYPKPSTFPQQTTGSQQFSPQKPVTPFVLKPTTSQGQFQSVQSSSQDKSSPSTLTQQYQGTLYEYNKPAESLPAPTHTDSTPSQSAQGGLGLKPQFGITEGSQASTDTQQGSKPLFGTQSSFNQFSQNTQSAQQIKPFESTSSNQASSSVGSQTTEESKPQLGTQSTYNKFGQNTQSIQSIKPFGSTTSTQVSSSFGSQTTQKIKPQFGSQSPFTQFGQNTQSAQPIKPFGSSSSTQGFSSFGTQSTYNKFGQNTQSTQSIKPFGSSTLSQSSNSFESQITPESKPQFGSQSLFSQFGQSTQSAQPIKPLGSALSIQGTSSFGSQTTQDSKPQFGSQSPFSQFGQNTQTAQPIKPLGSASSTQGASSFGSQTSQESKPQFGTQSTYNKFGQNTQSAQSIKPFGSSTTSQFSNSFGSQTTQESKPQVGTQSTFGQFGQNTQSAQPIKPFGSTSSTQATSSFGSQTIQESKPQFGSQSTYNKFGQNTQSVQSMKPFGSSTSTQGTSLFGSQITQESKPQFGSQSTYNKYGQNTQSVQSIKPFGSTTSSQSSNSFGSQSAQETKPQFGTQSPFSQFGQSTQSAQPIKPLGSASSSQSTSLFGSQTTQESKPQFGTQSTYNKFGQNTQSAQSIKPFGSSTSTQYSNSFGSQTTQESKPQVGTQSTFSQFGQNTQSAQPIKPLGSASSTQTSSSFGSQTTQESKPQFSTQSPFSQLGQNTLSAQPIQPLGSASSTQGSSSFGTQSSYNKFGQNTQSAQSIKPFGSSTSSQTSFGSQTIQESKPQIGSQLTYNKFDQNTQSVQSIKPFVSTTSSQSSNSFGSQNTQESKPQFGTQSPFSQFGQNTQSAQPIKPFGSSSSTQGSSSFGTQSSYNKFGQNTQSTQSITQFGSSSSTQTSDSFGSQATQESKPQFGTQSSFSQFGQNTQSAQPIKPFGSSTSSQSSNSFGSQTTQESKPQFGTQPTFGQFGQNTQSAQPIKPLGSASSTQGFNSFGTQSTYNKFGQNTQSTQSIKPFGSSTTPGFGFAGYQSSQGFKQQIGTQTTYNVFGQNTQSQAQLATQSKPFGSSLSSSAGSQNTGSVNIGADSVSAGSAITGSGIGKPSQEFSVAQGQFSSQTSGKGETFSGPKQPPKFDEKTGYYY